MIGLHRIIIESPRLKYEFYIKRFITIVQGDSATGKTTLIDLLREYKRSGEAGPIRIESDVPCVVFDGSESDWSLFISNKKRNIIFIDEGFGYIRTKEFAKSIQFTDNYYVLITRDSLTYLPYSINEIYGIRTSGKFHFPQKIYHEFYPIFDSYLYSSDNKKLKIITEDSKSGYIFLSNCVKKENCISSYGNSNIYKAVMEMSKKFPVVVVADGAAFGAFIAKLTNLAIIQKNIALYLPESFEWLVLKSGIINSNNLPSVLKEPEKFADTVEYFSWEQYFTDYLEKITQNDKRKKYKKEVLSDFYLEPKNKEKIISQFPLELSSFLIDKG